MNASEQNYTLNLEEEELPYYTKSFKALRNNFHNHAQMALVHLDGDLWELNIIGVTTREWVTFCAHVYSILPEEEAEAADSDLQDTAPAGEEAASEGHEPDTEPSGQSEEGGGPEAEEEPQRSVRKPIVVRKVGNSVTVEED